MLVDVRRVKEILLCTSCSSYRSHPRWIDGVEKSVRKVGNYFNNSLVNLLEFGRAGASAEDDEAEVFG
jgi:NMD protein affecting ribosome stability and mRNA decay